MQEAYKRAAELYRCNRKKHILNEKVEEKWIHGTPDFWFAMDEADGEDIRSKYMRYDGKSHNVAPLFDHERLAESIKQWNEKAAPNDLGVTIHEVYGTPELMYFSIKDTVGEFTLDLQSGAVALLRFPLHDKTEVTAPDKSVSAYIKEYNVYCRDNNTGKETRLTFDGLEGLEFGQRFNMVSEKLLKKDPMIIPPAICWSPDSKRFLVYRRDTRSLSQLHLVQSAPISGAHRPIGVSYPYALPEDEDILTAQLYVVDVENQTAKKIILDCNPFELKILEMFGVDDNMVKWTKDGKEACMMVYKDRYFKTAQAVIINAADAAARVAASHTYETFGFTEYFGSASQEGFQDSGLMYLTESRELIWLLEKENWASLYLIDADTGATKKDLTPGDYCPRRMRHYDEKTRTLWFSASAKEPGIDPYYQILYSVNLDSGAITRISKGDMPHLTRFHKDGGYYIDAFSTIQTVPETKTFDPAGNELCHLVTADLSRIMEKGYMIPEPFEAVARDGVTKIYGIIIKPHGFDASKKYPVVDYIYGGSQRINTPKAFEFGNLEADPQGGLQTLAQLGFVGIIVDGLATPLRGKKIHDYAYGKAEECCGIEDHVCAIKQLAEKHSWIDADRVGMWGASGGGYATARAMLQFGDFYKVGVSLCGDHDQAKYHAHWGDRWCGPYSRESYHNQANQNFAENLKGNLLLIHGDMDDNVHPSATIELAKNLIDANKDFDMLIYPNSAHGVGLFPYVVRRRWDYFVRHLMEKTPPREFTLVEPEKEEEKK